MRRKSKFLLGTIIVLLAIIFLVTAGSQYSNKPLQFRGISFDEAKSLSPDSDEDGVLNISDNCIGFFNPKQEDGDRDGVGDACSGYSFLLEQITRNLASHLNLSEADIRLFEYAEATWPNICLGVPEHEGLDVCGETKTPGYRLILEVKGEKYEYHTDKSASYEYLGKVAPTTVP